MAIVYAVKNGVWSDPTVWNTGSLPTSNDDVYPNGFIVDIDGTYTVGSIRNYADTNVNTGGYFRALNQSTLTCIGIPGVSGRGSVGELAVYVFEDLSFTSSATLIGYIQPQINLATTNKRSVEMAGNGTLYVDGTINMFSSVAPPQSTAQYGIVVRLGRLVGQGNIFGGNTASSLQRHAGIYLDSQAVSVDWVGNVSCHTSTGSFGVQNASASGTVNLAGNCYGSGYFNNGSPTTVGNVTAAGRAVVGPRISITGNVYGGNSIIGNGTTNGYGIDSQSYTITGNVYGGSQFVTSAINGANNFGAYGSGSVVGDLYGGYDPAAGAISAFGGNVTVTGTCYASAQCPAIVGSFGGTPILSGPFVAHPSGVPAVGGRFAVSESTTSVSMSYFRGAAPEPVTEYGLFDVASFESTLPAEEDVRENVIFGLEGAYTGSLDLPQTSTVLVGVTYDGGQVGSLDVAKQVWDAAVIGEYAEGSIGSLMKNVSTAPVTAAQIAALK